MKLFIYNFVIKMIFIYLYMKKLEQQKDKFLLRIDKNLKSKATEKAKKDDRSLNIYIVRLIESDLKLI